MTHFCETKIIPGHSVVFFRFENEEYEYEALEYIPVLPDHASPECHVDRYRFTSQPTTDRGEELSTSLGECTESLKTNNI